MLHDTPDRELCERDVRTFSSACIRVQDIMALTEWVLAETPGRDRSTIERNLATGREKTVRLAAPTPVHVLYWTAWADADGTAQFRTDVYDRDRRLLEALSAPPVVSQVGGP
jgi:murein L,D-transpeptidase YcbB/YkuD